MACCGTGTVNREVAAAWLRCFHSALGFGDTYGRWSEKSHARLYQLAAEMRDVFEQQYPDLAPLYDHGFGVDVVRTTQLASVMVLRHPAMRERFWACAGISEAEGAEQMATHAGPYWDTLMNALGVIYNAETKPAGHSKNDGVLAAACLVLGAFGTMFGFAR